MLYMKAVQTLCLRMREHCGEGNLKMKLKFYGLKHFNIICVKMF